MLRTSWIPTDRFFVSERLLTVDDGQGGRSRRNNGVPCATDSTSELCVDSLFVFGMPVNDLLHCRDWFFLSINKFGRLLLMPCMTWLQIRNLFRSYAKRPKKLSNGRAGPNPRCGNCARLIVSWKNHRECTVKSQVCFIHSHSFFSPPSFCL